MRKPCFDIRPSPIHGLGAFATRRIRKGMRIIEDRISFGGVKELEEIYSE